MTTSYHHISASSHPNNNHHHNNNAASNNHKNHVIYNNRPNVFHMKTYGKNLSTLSNGSLHGQHQIDGIVSPSPSSIINHHHPTRRYSSSTSLQSGDFGQLTSTNGSSNNVSPAASPQPNHHHYRSMTMNHSTKTNSLMRMNSASNLKSMKRWSASQEIRLSSMENVKYVTISLSYDKNQLLLFPILNHFSSSFLLLCYFSS